MISIPILSISGEGPSLLRVNHDIHKAGPSEVIVLSKWNEIVPSQKVGCVLTTDDNVSSRLRDTGIRSILVSHIPPIDDGDILQILDLESQIIVLYSEGAEHNVLFLTSRCTCNCLMCPEPPRKDDRNYPALATNIVDLVKRPPQNITLTGGEPTLLGKDLVRLVEHIRTAWPSSSIMILTNGQMLKDYHFVEELCSKDNSDLGFGIPLYADCEIIHDKIVRRPGAFSETLSGLLALNSANCFVEVRVVLLKQNLPRLARIVEYIGRNLPFVSRVVLMGLEPTGHARDSWDSIFIDPVECSQELLGMLTASRRCGVPLRLYNFQLCTLPKELVPLACSSISEWKRIFLPTCAFCQMRGSCAGFFSSQDSKRFLSKGLNLNQKK